MNEFSLFFCKIILCCNHSLIYVTNLKNVLLIISINYMCHILCITASSSACYFQSDYQHVDNITIFSKQEYYIKYFS